MCTLHSFPHNIQHCLTFARSEFEGLLEKGPAEANAFLTDPKKYIATVGPLVFSGTLFLRVPTTWTGEIHGIFRMH
jgi:hypothetical protein